MPASAVGVGGADIGAWALRGLEGPHPRLREHSFRCEKRGEKNDEEVEEGEKKKSQKKLEKKERQDSERKSPETPPFSKGSDPLQPHAQHNNERACPLEQPLRFLGRQRRSFSCKGLSLVFGSVFPDRKRLFQHFRVSAHQALSSPRAMGLICIPGPTSV